MAATATLTRVLFTNSRGQSITLYDDRDLGTAQTTIRLAGRAGKGIVPHDILTDRGPNQRGETYLDAVAQARVFTLRLITIAPNLNAADTLTRELAEVLDPSLGLGRLTYTREDGAVRCLDCIATSGLDFDENATDYWVQRIPVAMRAPSPDWYDPEPHTVSWFGQGGGLVFPMTFPFTFIVLQPSIMSVATIPYAGRAPSGPVFTLQGPMLRPRILHLNSGKVMAWNGDIPTGASLTVDMRPEELTWRLDAYGTSYDSTPPVTRDSTFFQLQPGDNQILITNNGPGAGGTAQMTFNDRYPAL